MNFLKKDGALSSGEHISVISAECCFQGTLNVQGFLRVEGRLEGSVDNARQVVVGENGLVEGNITAKTAILSGGVQGDVCADNVQIMASAKVQGAIKAKTLSVESGAQIKGKIDVEESQNSEEE